MARKRTDLTPILEQFPAVKTLNWDEVFREDIDLYGRVWRDILKFDQAEVGRPGPRPALDPHLAFKRWRQLTDEDYSDLPFVEAMRLISHDESTRKIAAATGLDRNTVQRLLSGQMTPDAYEMEVCALAYGRRPSYFLEWRVGFILKALHTHMVKFPESSVGPYKKLRDASNKKKL